jgi:hypothetical protein
VDVHRPAPAHPRVAPDADALPQRVEQGRRVVEPAGGDVVPRQVDLGVRDDLGIADLARQARRGVVARERRILGADLRQEPSDVFRSRVRHTRSPMRCDRSMLSFSPASARP